MKSLSLFTSLAGLLISATSVMAGSVSVSFTNGNQLVTKEGAHLPTGAMVRVGTFSANAETLAKTSDYAQLKSWFKPLGEGITGAGTITQINGSGTTLRVNDFPAAGNVFGGITNISDTYMAPGTTLYLWVFDNADPEKSNQWGIFTGATWVLPQPLGAQTLSSSLSVGALQGTSIAGVLALSIPKSTFGNWAMKNFASGTLSAAKASAADPDGDGIPNLAEYAWHLNPTAKDKVPTTVAKDLANGSSKFTFLAPKTLPDVQVVAESSTDLKTWTSASSTVIATDANFDTCQCSIPAGVTKCFWRVRVNSITAP